MTTKNGAVRVTVYIPPVAYGNQLPTVGVLR